MSTASYSNNEMLKQIVREMGGAGPTAEPVESLAMEEKELVLKDKEVLFSSFFYKPKGRDHAVRSFSPEDWHESVRCHIPKRDPNYIWPKPATEWLVVGLMNNDRCLLHGPKGTGKSTITEQVCAVLNIPYIRVNGREDMESGAIFGQVRVMDGSFEWVPGPAHELGMYGGVLQVDEVSATPAGINMAMQQMLELPGKIFLADKPGSSEEKVVEPNEWFRILATDNTTLQGDATGAYAGTMVQNEALIDRFTMTIELDYLGARHERKIVTKKVPGLDKACLDKLMDVVALLRKATSSGQLNYGMSIRGIMYWAEQWVYWNDPAVGLKLSFYNKLTDDDRKLVAEYYYKVFGKRL